MPGPAQRSAAVTASAADLITGRAVDLGTPSALDPVGLARLGEAIGDARVVMLGEPWHGDGGAIRLIGQVVEYLHRQHGFDVLIFEADFYSLNHAWRQALSSGDVDLARRNVWEFWSESDAAAPLWHYIGEALARGDTLHVAGMDTQMGGPLARATLGDSLRARLDGVPGVSREDAQLAGRVLHAALNQEKAAPGVLTPESFAMLVRAVRLLEAHLAGRPEERFWAQMAESMRRNLTGEPRDPGMASNLIWLARRQFPGRRVMVWGHNNHIVTDKWMFFEAPDSALQSNVIATLPEGAIGAAAYAGADARRWFGSRLYSIATVPYEGTYTPAIGPPAQNAPADFATVATLHPAGPGTLEHAFAARGYDIAFADLRGLRAGPTGVRTRVLDYSANPPLELRLWDGYDGVLFLRHTHGLNEPAP